MGRLDGARAAGYISLVVAGAGALAMAPGCTTNNYYHYGQGGDDGGGTTSSTAEVTTAASTTASATSSESGSSVSSTSSSTGSGRPCTDGDLQCDGTDTLLTCVDGAFDGQVCADACGANGFASNGCSVDHCQCGDPTDTTCLNGTQALCLCLAQAGQTCADDDYANYYQDCFHDTGTESPIIHCFADYISGNSVDCNAAESACL